MTNHINVPSIQGQIYCKRQNKIVPLTGILKICKNCKYFYGLGQGQGIECMWEDKDSDSPKVTIYNPQSEFNRCN